MDNCVVTYKLAIELFEFVKNSELYTLRHLYDVIHFLSGHVLEENTEHNNHITEQLFVNNRITIIHFYAYKTSQKCHYQYL